MPREPIRHLVAHFIIYPCRDMTYGGLVAVSAGYPPVTGMSLTCYAPFRRSPPDSIATLRAAPRLACVKPAASVHPEPGSNSSLYISIFLKPVLCSVFNSQKELTLFYLVLIACTFSLSVFQTTLKLAVISQTGCKDTDFFLSSK